MPLPDRWCALHRHLAVHGEDADAQSLLGVDLLDDLLSEDDVLLGGRKDLVDDGDLTGVDDGLAIEAHQVDVLDVLAEAVHVLRVGEDGVEALHACCAGCNDHLLTGAHQLNAGAGDVGLQILGVVTTGKCDTDQTVRRLADL